MPARNSDVVVWHDGLGFSCGLHPADHLRIFSLVHSRKDKRNVDLISDALSFSRLWYGDPTQSEMPIGSHNAVIRVYDAAGNLIETHERAQHPISAAQERLGAAKMNLNCDHRCK